MEMSFVVMQIAAKKITGANAGERSCFGFMDSASLILLSRVAQVAR